MLLGSLQVLVHVALCAASVLPETMRAVRKTGIKGCGPPDFACVQVQSVTTPEPGLGEVLIKVAASSLNPDELRILEQPAVHYTLGLDVSGIVVALGAGCSSRLAIGDRVYATGIGWGMGEFAVRPEFMCGIVPGSVDLVAAGTMPTVAMTVYGALRNAGAPWKTNVTVLITAGSGGTGYVAVQLAKAMGAGFVVSAASAAHLAFVRSLGADLVVDYRAQSVFDVVSDRSVDVVLSNHADNTSAVRSMQKLRAGGVYVTLDGDMLPSGTSPPTDVRLVDYDLFAPAEAVRCLAYLDAIAAFLANHTVRALVQDTFSFAAIRDALRTMAAGDVASKLAVVP